MALNLLINGLSIRCRNCSWTGKNEEKEVHWGQCPNLTIACRNDCGESFQRRDEGNHIEDCTREKVMCEVCKKDIERRELPQHLSDCEEGPIHCPLSCNELISR